MKKIYRIQGLDCPNCAREVEEFLNTDERIEKAVIDFMGKKLFVTYRKEEYEKEELEKKILSVEDGITLEEYQMTASSQTETKKNPFYRTMEFQIIRLVVASVLLAFAYFWEMKAGLKLAFYILAYLIAGIEVIFQMIKGFTKKQIFTEYTLMTVATIGAMAIQEYPEAILVMILYQIGELLQDASVDKSRKSIQSTIALRPKIAHRVHEEDIETITPEQLQIDDVIEIKIGEIVPVDGILEQGGGTLDMSSLTGESIPVSVEEGNEVLSGSILLSGYMRLRVQKTYQDSTVSKILELIEMNGEKKAKAEKFVTRFARIYTPIVFAVALCLAIIPPLFNQQWTEYIYKALTFLVVSCPCSIVISIPLAYYIGMGEMAKRGILIKGAHYMDILNQLKTVVTDKTGTLTKGQFSVIKIVTTSLSEEQVLEYAAYAESISHHPIALSIVKRYGKPIDPQKVTMAAEMAGQGVEVMYDGKRICVGNASICPGHQAEQEIGTIAYMTIDGQYEGYLLLADEIKEGSQAFIDALHQYRIQSIMLTGDKKTYAAHVAEQLHVDHYYAECMPEDKVKKLEEILADSKNQKVLFVGDGVNDAPCIIRADIGVAMGAMGSEAAIEASDMVIMNDDLRKVLSAIRISHVTRNTSLFNLCAALTAKFVVYILALCNISSMWIALLADVGVTLLLIANSIYMKTRLKRKTAREIKKANDSNN